MLWAASVRESAANSHNIMLSNVEYKSIVAIVPKRRSEGKGKGAARFPFAPGHPQHGTHEQQLREKQPVPQLVGPMTPRPPPNLGFGVNASATWQRANERFLGFSAATHVPLWDYYVKGCPAHININVKTSRGLVNGCMAVMDSITLAEGCGTLEELLAGMPADETELELSQPPHTINVVPDLPPDEMAVLVASGLSLDAGRLVVPVPRHPRVLIHKLRSQYSAVHGMPKELKVIRHQLELAFAYTDFKLQSKTKTKLIISIGPRKFKPSLSLSTIYVLASRVKLGLQLRVIGFDVRRDGHRHLTSLQHPSELGIWELGYRRDSGEWDDALRDEAIRAAIGGELPASLYDLGNEMDEDDLHEQEED